MNKLSLFLLSFLITSNFSVEDKINDINYIRSLLQPGYRIRLNHGYRCGNAPLWTSNTNITFENDSYNETYILIEKSGLQVCNYFKIESLRGIELLNQHGDIINSITW